MSPLVNYYHLLAVPQTASLEQIKQAFRKLARQYHPDLAGAASKDQFLRIHEAYQVLSDPERRRAFDARLQEHARPNTPPKTVVQPPATSRTPDLALKRFTLREQLKKKRYTLVITEAEAFLQQAPDLEIRHLLALAYQRLGNALLYRGDRVQAKNYLQKALATEPQNSELAFEVQRDLARL